MFILRLTRDYAIYIQHVTIARYSVCLYINLMFFNPSQLNNSDLEKSLL